MTLSSSTHSPEEPYFLLFSAFSFFCLPGLACSEDIREAVGLPVVARQMWVAVAIGVGQRDGAEVILVLWAWWFDAHRGLRDSFRTSPTRTSVGFSL